MAASWSAWGGAWWGEWATYRPADLLLFSARTYERLFERVNAEAGLAVWLGPLLAVAVLAAARRGWRGALPCGGALLALAWAWVAWAYHATRFAPINPAAPAYATAFALQGLGWLVAALRAMSAPQPAVPAGTTASRAARAAAAVLLAVALAMPAAGWLAGRPWAQAEWFGLAPDPTAIAGLGALLLWPRTDRAGRWLWRALWPIPLAWCAVSGLTLSAMQSPLALLPPAAALLALLALARSARRGAR